MDKDFLVKWENNKISLARKRFLFYRVTTS